MTVSTVPCGARLARIQDTLARARAVPSSSPPSYSVSGASIAALLRYAAEVHAPIDAVLAELGLAPAALANPEARVPAHANDLVWERAAAATGDPDLGLHFAERMDLDAYHLVGHLAATAATLGAAIERIVAYSRLLHDAGRTELEREGELARVYPGCRGLWPQPSRHVAEFSAASLVLLGRVITGTSWSPRHVCFAHAAPPRVREHARIFGSPVRFDAPETVVVLESTALALPIRAVGTRIGAYLEAYARELLARLPAGDTSLRAQVERALARGVTHGVPDIARVAAHLGMTARTLQRRLAEQGTSFVALSDAARRACAERLLADDRLPLAEVAFLVGFSDPSNFHKAFRRWTGESPGAFRARHAAAHHQASTR